MDKITVSDIYEYSAIHGKQAASDLLLLAGYDGFEGTYEEYNELMKILTQD